MTGNRGILHDGNRHVIRPWQVRRWIACRLEVPGRRRIVMRPHSWTELFFLDEATSLSAGHRPCAECRRADYRRFRSLWESCFGAPSNADAIDDRLHAHRLDGRAKRTYREDVANVPDGTYVAFDGVPSLILGSELLEWSDTGYTNRRARPSRGEVDVLTPRPTVTVLAAGYRPGIHPSGLR
jgi:hypothetical protein